VIKRIIFLIYFIIACSKGIANDFFSPIIVEKMVNDTLEVINQNSSDIGVFKDSSFVIVWIEEQSNNRNVVCQQFDANWTKIGNQYNINNNLNYCKLPKITIINDEDFILTWIEFDTISNNWNILGQYLNKNNSNINITNTTIKNNIYITGLTTESDSDNNFIVLWSESDEEYNFEKSIIYLQKYTNTFQKIGNAISISTGYEPCIGLNKNGKGVLSWINDNIIYAKEFHFSDSLFSNNSYQVNNVNSISSAQKVSINESGDYIISWRKRTYNSSQWDETTSIYSKLYKFGNNSLGKNITITSRASNFSYFNVAINTNYAILIWEDHRKYSYMDGSELYLQKLNLNGNLDGDNFHLTNIDSYTESSPSLFLLDNILFTSYSAYKFGNWDIFLNISSIENKPNNIDYKSVQFPSTFTLYQNFPNPFNPKTIIKYNIQENQKVKLDIYNLEGKLVKTLVNEYQTPGEYNIILTGTDLSTGIYFYKLIVGSFVETKKCMLLKYEQSRT